MKDNKRTSVRVMLIVSCKTAKRNMIKDYYEIKLAGFVKKIIIRIPFQILAIPYRMEPNLQYFFMIE